MPDRYMRRRTPVVLLVNQQEWTARSLESVLRPAGYAVVKVHTGRQAIELASRLRPDLAIVDYRLSDVSGLDACRAIREFPNVDDATPFIIATSGGLSRQERHECFRAGIWDVFSSPFDPIELVSKLHTFIGARRQVEDAWESTLTDPSTGLYNWNALFARAQELVADAQRASRWTTCVALGLRVGQTSPSSEESIEGVSEEVLQLLQTDSESPPLLERISSILRDVTRDSDSMGVLGMNDFLVLAPGTDEGGAEVLASRLVDALNDTTTSGERQPPELEFSAGYYAARDGTGESIRAEDLIGRTVEALRAAQAASSDGSTTILPFRSS